MLRWVHLRWSDMDGVVVIWKAVGFRDMLAPASVI